MLHLSERSVRQATAELHRDLRTAAAALPIPPAPPLPPPVSMPVPPAAPQPRWYVLETAVNPVNPARAYLARDDQIATTSITARNPDDVQTLHEAAHAMNHHGNLRDVLFRAGAQLVRSNYAGGLLSEIDRMLADSQA